MPQKSNFFDLESPDQWICQVRKYTASHSQMQIQVYNPQTHITQYLNFIDVAYFDGPMMWRGCDFEVSENAECRRILSLVVPEYKTASISLEEDYLLFIANTSKSELSKIQIRIIAAPTSSLTLENLFG